MQSYKPGVNAYVVKLYHFLTSNAVKDLGDFGQSSPSLRLQREKVAEIILTANFVPLKMIKDAKRPSGSGKEF